MKVYDYVKMFKKQYPMGVTWWRLKKHSQVIQMHLNPKEVVSYAFPAQKNDSVLDLFSTAVVAITNKRILIGQKRVLYGYILNSITPDLYNDMQVYGGLIWGTIKIDTVKEVVTLTNLPKKALTEIETKISEYMLEAKKAYKMHNEDAY